MKNLVLVGIFALHNAEETLGMSRELPISSNVLKRIGLEPQDYTPENFGIAAGLLTAVVAASSILPQGRISTVTNLFTCSALGINAWGHIARAIIQRRYNAGLATAPLMLLSSTKQISQICSREEVSLRTMFKISATSGAASFPIIIGALKISRKFRFLNKSDCRAD